jgi:phosphoserine phosphatase RsbU/P
MSSTKSLQFAELTKQATETLKQFTEPILAAPELIRFLCRWFDCEWGTYWHVDQGKGRLVATSIWNKDSIRAVKLRRDTESRSLGMSEGTAGQVWRNGLPVCTNDIVLGLCLPRSIDAVAVGLKGGIWFPIRTHSSTFAVIELLGQHYWSCDKKFLNELSMLGQDLAAVYADADPSSESRS